MRLPQNRKRHWSGGYLNLGDRPSYYWFDYYSITECIIRYFDHYQFDVTINILLITLFTKSVLEFTTFPTLLLITMFRLGLNLSSTRLILTQKWRTRDRCLCQCRCRLLYIVGIILFVIIMVVQLVVVTNGAGRVSEVTARFTLDAMPGKQMAIDSDLNAGLITEADAANDEKICSEKLISLVRWMVPASLSRRCDPGILITVINLVGGAIIFSMGGQMTVMEAFRSIRETGDRGWLGQLDSLFTDFDCFWGDRDSFR